MKLSAASHLISSGCVLGPDAFDFSLGTSIVLIELNRIMDSSAQFLEGFALPRHISQVVEALANVVRLLPAQLYTLHRLDT